MHPGTFAGVDVLGDLMGSVPVPFCVMPESLECRREVFGCFVQPSYCFFEFR